MKRAVNAVLAVALFPFYLVATLVAVAYWIVAALVRGGGDE